MNEHEITATRDVLDRNITALNARDIEAYLANQQPDVELSLPRRGDAARTRPGAPVHGKPVDRLARRNTELRRTGSRQGSRGHRSCVYRHAHRSNADTARIDRPDRKTRLCPLRVDPAHQGGIGRLRTRLSRPARNADATRTDASCAEHSGQPLSAVTDAKAHAGGHRWSGYGLREFLGSSTNQPPNGFAGASAGPEWREEPHEPSTDRL